MGGLLFTLALLALGYGAGRKAERGHLEEIRRRERATAGVPTITFVPRDWEIREATLVEGNVVVSLDYFKRFVAGLRGIVGGQVRSYEPLLDRARREAVLRMKAQAISRDFDAVINVRLETSRLASALGDGKGTAGVEILAFGTAVRRF